MRLNLNMLGAALMAIASMPFGQTARFQSSYIPAPRSAKQHNRSTAFAPNGNRECERRRRQIAAGQIRAENGLVRE